MPLAKSIVPWIDRDTLIVATDYGADSLTISSYPRLVKRWRRGTTLEAAELVFEVPVDHVRRRDSRPYHGYERDLVADVIDFYHSKVYLIDGDALTHIDVPDDANVDLHREWLLIRPGPIGRLPPSPIRPVRCWRRRSMRICRDRAILSRSSRRMSERRSRARAGRAIISC